MLDFSQVTGQIKTFSQDRIRSLPQFRSALREAECRLDASSPDWEQTRDRIELSKTSWLIAQWHEAPDAHAAPVPRPMPHTVLAADGSQIVADRHDIALCYLLNVGSIALRYGTGERATLTSRPILAAPEEDLLEESQGEVTAIATRRLSIKRQIAEIEALVDLIRTIQPDGPGTGVVPAIALFDGSLILWTLETEQDAFREETLETLRDCLETARQHRVPIIGYISQSASRDVVNSLRIYACPHPVANCDRYCPHRGKPRPAFVPPDCAGIERIRDVDLFAERLRPEERSAVFGSGSRILGLYGDHDVRFFYLHTGREIARCEVPKWVAEAPELLDLAHTLCIDQCRKGDGYPVALSEAHEQAIIRNPERTAFFHLMEREFVTSRQSIATTQKAVSKRARRV